MAGCGMPPAGRGHGRVPPLPAKCADPVRQDLGHLSTYNEEVGAWFTTTGGVHNVTATWVGRPVWKDAWGYHTHLGFGPVSDPPVFVPDNALPRNEQAGVSVDEGEWGVVELSAGRYWVTSGDAAVVWIETCPPTVVSRIRRTQHAPTPRPSPSSFEPCAR